MMKKPMLNAIQKVKMYVDVENAVTVQGDSASTITGMMFERLGDT